MNRLAILIFQASCLLLYAALAVHLVSTYGWTLLLLFVVQFALLMMVQYQVTAQRKELDDLKAQINKSGMPER